ncbi:hypothetical protein RSOLAG1IB_11341 [Rhizoctonia solani AG-1 IB]|uniref:Laminin domain protein n=1 Tax=Thanatephorus cucumeris (strain AG1-IB / isolate 7/3/14) TaxID=1108050 RepID=A0A0B7F921_THACB|nr:hypothetical protein RSOLAG1IB_11341 [Rhizoctonia solani AG-1 IB]
MATETPGRLVGNEHTYTPPELPNHLASVYDLKPIVGCPCDEEVKMIHAAIRAVNIEAQVPHLYNPELSLQLSQHLFSVQMAIYRKAYPSSLFPADNVYTPPSLPVHISAKLEPVVGTPSNEQLKAAQNAIRISESLGISPLFDPDLNMQLSQHLFNLQFARYIQDSSSGQFASKTNGGQNIAPVARGTHAHSSDLQSATSFQIEDLGSMSPQSKTSGPHKANRTEISVLSEHAKPESCTSSQITQLVEAINGVTGLMSESKGVLDNMNRVLIAIQRSQVMVREWSSYDHARSNPVNDQGVTAVEWGLPQLRFAYCRESCSNYALDPAALVGYLRFFGIGADLIEGNEKPRLKDSKFGNVEAWKLIQQHLGL